MKPVDLTNPEAVARAFAAERRAFSRDELMTLRLAGHKLRTEWTGVQSGYARGTCECGWRATGWNHYMRDVRRGHQGHLLAVLRRAAKGAGNERLERVATGSGADRSQDEATASGYLAIAGMAQSRAAQRAYLTRIRKAYILRTWRFAMTNGENDGSERQRRTAPGQDRHWDRRPADDAQAGPTVRRAQHAGRSSPRRIRLRRRPQRYRDSRRRVRRAYNIQPRRQSSRRQKQTTGELQS